MTTRRDSLLIAEAALFTPLGEQFGQGVRQWGLPLILDSEPGASKTAFWWALATKWFVRAGGRIAFNSITAGAQGEGRFGVVPVPTKKGTLTFPAPDDLVRDFADGIGMCLWDDLGTLDRGMSAVALDGMQMRRIGTHYLGARVRCVGGTNAAKDTAGNGDDLPFSVENRCGWLRFDDPTENEWAQWLMFESDVPSRSMLGPVNALEKEEARVLALWTPAYTEAAVYVGEYVKKTKSLRGKVPLRSDDTAGRAVGTPRTWEYATRMLASCRLRGYSPALQRTGVAAFVGEGSAAELMTFIKNANLPTPEMVLAGKVKLSSLRLDIAYMMCATLLGHVRQHAECLPDFWRVVGDIAEENRDMLGLILTQAEKLGFNDHPSAGPVLASMTAIMGIK